jgi:hypothetical protein
MRHALLAAPLSVLLAACSGGADPGSPPAERALERDERPAGAMTAWGKKLEIDCPRRFDIPERADGMPVDDLRGLRLGVPGEVAIRFAQCPDGEEADSIYEETADIGFRRNEGGLDIRTGASVALGTFPERWRGPDIIDADLKDQFETPQSVWHFVMDGMPGRETLYGMWLDQVFPEGARPTIDSQMTALKTKYGEPTLADERGRLFWLHLPDGRPIPAFDRQLINRCSHSIGPTNRSLQWSPDCGLVIAAEVQRSQNPLQAASVHVAVFDPAKLWDYQENRFAAERDALLAQQAGAESENTKGGSF